MSYPGQLFPFQFYTFSCQKFAHLSVTSLKWRWFHTFRCQKRCTLRTLRILRRFCQMAWQGIEAPKQTSEFPAALSFSSKIKLIPKSIGNRKRDCAWGCARRINTTWENLQIEKHKPERRSFRSPDWFVLFDLQIFSGGVYPPSATSHTISFLFPIVFGIILLRMNFLWICCGTIFEPRQEKRDTNDIRRNLLGTEQVKVMNVKIRYMTWEW